MPPSVRTILEDVAREHAVCVSDILGADRHRRTYLARHEAVGRLRAMTYGRGRPSLVQIGGWLGGRDHATILNSLRRYEEGAR